MVGVLSARRWHLNHSLQHTKSDCVTRLNEPSLTHTHTLTHTHAHRHTGSVYWAKVQPLHTDACKQLDAPCKARAGELGGLLQDICLCCHSEADSLAASRLRKVRCPSFVHFSQLPPLFFFLPICLFKPPMLLPQIYPVHLKTTNRQAKSYNMNLIIKYIFSIFCFLCYCAIVFLHSSFVLWIQINGKKCIAVISYVLYVTIFLSLARGMVILCSLWVGHNLLLR